MNFFSLIFWRYAIVGAMGTICDIVLLYFLYEFFYVGLLLSTALAGVGGAIVNFVINRIWTFSNTSSSLSSSFIRFMMVASGAIILNIIFMWILVDLFHWYYLFSKILITIGVFIFHYACNSFWTFRAPVQTTNLENTDPVYTYDLSIVIPVYNEENRIIPTLENIFSFLKGSSFEVIIVDDGSTDQTKSVITSTFGDQCSMISFEKNKGKGAAVKEGVLHSEGRMILFMDADGSTPIDQISRLMKYIDTYPIVIGSRYTEDADLFLSQGIFRKRIGRFGNFFVQLLFIEGIIDSQCGFKLFQSSVAKKLFSLQKVDRFGFDIEVLLLAKKYGYKMKEVGVRWENDKDSRFHPFYDTLYTAGEFIHIKWMMMRGKYDQ